MAELRALSDDEWQHWRSLRLEALRDAPDAFNATLREWSGDGDREERWRARLTEVPFNVIAELDGVPAGMVSGTHPSPDGMVLLISMWVAPFARGRGVGDELIASVIAWAGKRRAAGVELEVRDSNAHALALYARNGFIDRGPSERVAPPQRRMTYAL